MTWNEETHARLGALLHQQRRPRVPI